MRNWIILVALLGAHAASAAQPARPNILILFIDNVGYGDIGCYGNRDVKTPNIDRLAAQGVRCTDFYAIPSCSPSRGAILTGRHPERNGLNYQLAAQSNMGMGPEGLPLTEKIIPQFLKPLGYATACFGKWNIGFTPGMRPLDRGFDEFLGFRSGNIGYYNYIYHGENDLRLGNDPIDRRGTYCTDLFADSAVDFIRRHRAGPWFVYLPFNATHFVTEVDTLPGEKLVRWQVPDKYLALYGCAPDEADQTKRFRAVLTALDDGIGRVLAALDDLSLRDNTLVMCISDNGAFVQPSRSDGESSNSPLRDGGVTTYEGGVRTPAIFRWPGRIKPGSTCREMITVMDVLPTAVTAAGGAPPTDRVLDGRDIAPVLAGDTKSPHEAVYHWWNQGKKEQWRAVRRGDFKLIRKADADPWQLYNLLDDIGESKDIAALNPELTANLAARFSAWHESVMNDPTRGRGVREKSAK